MLIMTFFMLETVMLLACSTITLGRMVRKTELSRKQMVVTCNFATPVNVSHDNAILQMLHCKASV